jgi:hypothetical protein
MARIDLIGERRTLVGLMAVPMIRQMTVTLVSVAASLIMALMVAIAAMAIEQSADATCLVADSEPCATDPTEWCRSVNEQLQCIGEPN